MHVLAPAVTLRSLLGDDGTRLRSVGEQALRGPHDVLEYNSLRPGVQQPAAACPDPRGRQGRDAVPPLRPGGTVTIGVEQLGTRVQGCAAA